jgi:hypothetical protein
MVFPLWLPSQRLCRFCENRGPALHSKTMNLGPQPESRAPGSSPSSKRCGNFGSLGDRTQIECCLNNAERLNKRVEFKRSPGETRSPTQENRPADLCSRRARACENVVNRSLTSEIHNQFSDGRLCWCHDLRVWSVARLLLMSRKPPRLESTIRRTRR